MANTNRLAEALKNQAAVFLNKYANRQAMLTVTDAKLSGNQDRATIFITVLPPEKSKAGLDFANRHRQDFRQWLKTNLKPSRLPQITFALDPSAGADF